jgi:hypothetical protein
MKTTYAAPVATTRGDVVHSTLGSKPSGLGEVQNTIPGGGSALSFGL